MFHQWRRALPQPQRAWISRLTAQQEDKCAPKRARHVALLLFFLKLPFGSVWVGGLRATEFWTVEVLSRIGAQQLQSSAAKGLGRGGNQLLTHKIYTADRSDSPTTAFPSFHLHQPVHPNPSSTSQNLFAEGCDPLPGLTIRNTTQHNTPLPVSKSRYSLAPSLSAARSSCVPSL
jgi:hypothetical protein